MGERVFRPGIRTSERTAANIRDGGWMAQVFYDWLITIVDDYGRYDARPSILRAEMFPLLLDLVREADAQRCLESCEAAGLIRLYTTDEKPYLEVLNFRQRLRAKASKWPHPPDNPPHSHVNVVTMPTTTETETDTETTTEKSSLAERKADAESFSRCWITAEAGSYLKNGQITAFAECIIGMGKERAVAEVRKAMADTSVNDPFFYVRGILRGQETDKGKRAHHKRTSGAPGKVVTTASM